MNTNTNANAKTNTNAKTNAITNTNRKSLKNSVSDLEQNTINIKQDEEYTLKNTITIQG